MDELFGDRWFGAGCGGSQMSRHKWNLEEPKKRLEFLSKYNTRHPDGLNELKISYPFFHNLIIVEGCYAPLDPLMVPLVRHMNTIEGVNTITSCQGTARWSPYVFFSAASLDSLSLLHKMIDDWHRKINEGWHWNEVGITYECKRDEGYTFLLQFYDLIALVKFTYEYLSVPLEEQLKIPDKICLIRKNLNIETTSIEEWQKLIRTE